VILNEIGFKDLDWIHRIQDRETCVVLVKTVMNI